MGLSFEGGQETALGGNCLSEGLEMEKEAGCH